jgi:xanthine dehydrogenase YagS FAD-binding subunit
VHPFSYCRPSNAENAVLAVRAASSAARSGAGDLPTAAAGQFIAGGTNMTDYMTLGVVQPKVLVDVNDLPARYKQIHNSDRALRLGALVRMAEAEDHPTVRSDYPVIQQALKLAASRQIRNMASLGGNVLQKTRCEYFREVSWPCNKRNPGAGCAALEGLNREHAVLGTSGQCIATYHGDLAQALIALDAMIETTGNTAGPRRFPFAELHRLPGTTPHQETCLTPGEFITFIEVPAGPWTRRSCYVKVRDRQSYQFAITSAAVALDLDHDLVRSARIALGGVATVPWRARAAEAALKGMRLNEQTAAMAADLAFTSARISKHNAFKVPTGKQTLIRALLEAQSL